MKTMPPPGPQLEAGPQYWRSLEQLADRPEFHQWLDREFPEGASEWTDPVSRRHFMQIMSASFLLAGLGLTGCRRPEHKLLPFSKQPENYIHGKAEYYATAMPTRFGGIPLLAKSNEGRPTKVEGNPEHPLHVEKGPDGQPRRHAGTDAVAQASVLSLYDIDRATRFAKGKDDLTREAALDFLKSLATKFTGTGGQGLAFLLQRDHSPSRTRVIAELRAKLPQARWFAHEPVDLAVHRQAASLAFGKPVSPQYQFDQARLILSLDCDFIGTEGQTAQFCRDFAKGRRLTRPSDAMNRLYAVEGLMTLTGMNADHRLRLPTSAVTQVAARFAEKVLGADAAAIVQAARAAGPLDEAKTKWIDACAADFLKPENRDKTLVVAGHRQPLAVHLLAQAVNAALGNLGHTIHFHEEPAEDFGSLADLAGLLNANAVDTLVIVGANPVYDAPADLTWPETQRKAKTVLRLGYAEDETGVLCDYHFPLAHYLESWGDARSHDGTLLSIQPLIEPLFGGLTEIEVLARIGALEQVRAYDIVRETFRGLGTPAFEEDWKRFLHNGFWTRTSTAAAPVQINYAAVAAAIKVAPAPAPSREQIEVVFLRDARLDDGRWNNNGWLQEMPDPVTKVVWENVVLMSKKTADELGVFKRDNQIGQVETPRVRIELGGRSIEGPVWVQPGMADYTVALPLGYGRTLTGRVGRGSGFSAYLLRTSAAPFVASGGKAALTGAFSEVACTQSHWALEGRPVIREAHLEDFRKHPDFTKRMDLEQPHNGGPLYPNPLDQARQHSLHDWGMAIDLATCVGCSACVLACQSENNVPIVGKRLVGRSREMHWLRIDRYYSGPVEDPQAVNQPMMCQHCEAAPCESVCPVNATVHDHEGLNLMVYNRCVGTRYCSNNCPYKVRRFNYFDYHKRPLARLFESPLTSATDGEWEAKRWAKNPDRPSRPQDEFDLLKLLRNPDVSVRMRGVMEKCTFCLQRIEGAKIARKVRARDSGDVVVPDGTFTTACAQACPTEAIVFGNLKDPDSHVSRLKQQERNYSVLDFLHTKPRLTYLARIRNPNPDMPDYAAMPASLREYSAKSGSPFEAHGGGAHEAPATGHGTAKGQEH